MISIVACCHGAKLCAHAARDFRSQQFQSWTFPNDTPSSSIGTILLNTMKVKLSKCQNKIISSCMSKDQVWRIIFSILTTNRTKFFTILFPDSVWTLIVVVTAVLSQYANLVFSYVRFVLKYIVPSVSWLKIITIDVWWTRGRN